MSEDIKREEILKYLQQQGNQNLDANLESMLMSLILNPLKMSTIRTQLMDNLNNGVISETMEGSVLNEAGIIEDKKPVNMYMLDDGTSLNEVVRCQSCGGLVKEKNLYRCPCGKTCCVRENCGKTDSNGRWYCSSWHRFLGGTFGMNLR